MSKNCKAGKHVIVNNDVFSHTMYMNHEGHNYRYEFEKLIADRCSICKGFYMNEGLQKFMNMEFEEYLKLNSSHTDYVWEVFPKFVPGTIKMELKKDCPYCEGEGFLYCSSKYSPSGLRKIPCSICLKELYDDDREIEKRRGIDRYRLLNLIHRLIGGFVGEFEDGEGKFIKKCVSEYISLREYYEDCPNEL